MLHSIAIIDVNTGKNTGGLARSIDWQVRTNLAPAWGFHATVFSAPADARLPSGTWKLYICAEPSDAEGYGRLGYHRHVGLDAVPTGYVFTGPCERFDELWTEIASHEVIEMLGDPWINLEVRRGDELWARELCDPVQGQRYRTPLVDGVEVANFVLPEYFIEGADGPYDHLGLLTKPFDVAETGYALVTTPPGGRRAVYGANYPSWRRELRPASRRAQRQGVHPCTASSSSSS